MATREEIVKTVSTQLEKKDLSNNAILILQKSTQTVLDRIKQNVDAQLKEDSSPIVNDFIEKITKKMSVSAQQWSDSNSNELLVFPEGTRYIFRDGRVTTIVVEEKPQVRHIEYNGKIYLLSFPYVQFIIQFQNGEPVKQLFVGCTKKPIQDLDEAMFHLPLPNITSHKVCTGDSAWPSKKNMTEAVNAIIGSFWQSSFTGDGASEAVTFADTNFKKKSLQEGFELWEIKTKENSLFSIDKTTKYRPGQNFRATFGKDNGSNGQVSIVATLQKEIVQAVGNVGEEVKKLLGDIDFKTENRAKAHTTTLQSVLKEIIVQAYSELWEYAQMELRTERDKLQRQLQEEADRLTKNYTKYIKEATEIDRTW